MPIDVVTCDHFFFHYNYTILSTSQRNVMINYPSFMPIASILYFPFHLLLFSFPFFFSPVFATSPYSSCLRQSLPHPSKQSTGNPTLPSNHHLTSHQHHQQNTTLLNNRIKSQSANTKQKTASRPNHHKHTSNQMRPKLNSQKASTMPPSTIKSIPNNSKKHTEHKPTNHHLNRCYEPPSTLTWSPKDLLPQTHIKSYHLG